MLKMGTHTIGVGPKGWVVVEGVMVGKNFTTETPMSDLD